MSEYTSLMRMALELAARGGRSVRPNPQVGACIRLVDGRILAAFHKQSGGAHAEIEVLRACHELNLSVEGATIVVTLEPCSHHGKTPPCALALVKARLKKVIVSMEDPNPKVQGRGLKILRDAGLEVEVGVLERECEALNHEWLLSHKEKRPYIYLKMATTAEGAWTTADKLNRWITGEEARAHSHVLREHVDALVTSLRTIESDDPSLTARFEDGRSLREHQPKIYVLTRQKNADVSKYKINVHPKGFQLCELSSEPLSLRKFMADLYAQDIHMVMVEAGPSLTKAFLLDNLWDEIWHYEAPPESGLDINTTVKHGYEQSSHLIEEKRFANGDMLKIYRKGLLSLS